MTLLKEGAFDLVSVCFRAIKNRKQLAVRVFACLFSIARLLYFLPKAKNRPERYVNLTLQAHEIQLVVQLSRKRSQSFLLTLDKPDPKIQQIGSLSSGNIIAKTLRLHAFLHARILHGCICNFESMGLNYAYIDTLCQEFVWIKSNR